MRVLIRRLCRSLGQAELLAGRRVRDDALAPEVLVGLPKLLHELVARILADLVLRLVDLALLVLEELDVVELDLEVAGFAEIDVFEEGSKITQPVLDLTLLELADVELADGGGALGKHDLTRRGGGEAQELPVLGNRAQRGLVGFPNVHEVAAIGEGGEGSVDARGGSGERERERQGPDGEAARHRWRGQAAGRRGGEVVAVWLVVCLV